MGTTSLTFRLRDFFWSDPLMGVAIAVALFAYATTPLAFALLGRLNYLHSRRGRALQAPSFASVVCGMMLVMGIPAVFCALVVKSRTFDRNRYEFDPNTTWSVLDQGRQFRTLRQADEAVRGEMKRLAEERKNLVDNVKRLDESMLILRAAAAQAPATARALPGVLRNLAGVRKSVGVDGPQQLQDFTAPPADLPAVPLVAATGASVPIAPPPALAVAPAGNGLAEPELTAELAAVPAPQRPLAAMLPLADLPPGWTLAMSGARHLETFNAENLFEKIDGRAESFLQYDVRGMAYTYYHPDGDESNEVQLYIFEMGSSLKALGKYGSEKPDGMAVLPLGTEGYSSAGSTLFYQDKYYTQIVSTRDDPKFSAFALELAKRIAATQRPAPAPTVAGSPSPGAGGAAVKPQASPEDIFKLLPSEPKPAAIKFVAQDAFGYSFLADVFMADYREGEASWQGFLRPYRDAAAAKAIFEKYLANAKENGAEVKAVEPPPEGTQGLVIASNFGLIDAVFLKGNAVGGANGAADAARAEAFATAFAKSLPAAVPAIEDENRSAAGDAEKDKNQ